VPGSEEQSKLMVLVVEDEWFVRLVIVDFLTSLGHTIIEAESGEAALAVLQQRDGLDVLFTDIRLGGKVNGWDVAEAFRASHPDLPVIYTSGAAIRPERPVPGSLFFAKPYDPQKVHAAFLDLAEK
jgi:two-component system, OmpR family, response regulator